MARNSETRDFFGELALACTLLTRIPMPMQDGVRDMSRSAWAWPLVGLLTGALSALGAVMALALGLSAPLAAGVALGVGVVVTGAMHEDGLADTADGFWGGQTRARRLEIMRDSRIGTYGVLALVFSVLIRWAALSVLVDAGWIWIPLLVAGTASRAAMVVAMHLLANARSYGLSHGTGRPDRATTLVAVGLAGAVALVLTGYAAFAIALVTATVLACAIEISRRKIGGQTGDTLGATQQICECAVLLMLVSAMG